MQLKKRKGISFAQASRKKLSLQQQLNPGPGHYQSKYLNPQHSKSFTFSKQQSPIKLAHWNKIGPGYYNIKKQDKQAVNIIFTHSTRFSHSNLIPSPAPGQHEQETKFDRKNTVYNKCPKYTFAKSKRPDFVQINKSLSPGPGSYQAGFSEFSERSKRIFNILKRL